ncbi:hypothetical protein KJ885_03365 [Patescibacteria group bacterium]|nr:hypothetical protein [Patescibacteria group bacterium]
MPKQTTKQILITLAIIISLFLVNQIIMAWTAPAAAPPANNATAPINVSVTTQYKSGALGVGGIFHGYSDITTDGRFNGNGSVPAGAVMAFDLASCPTGWSEYTSARDRTIIGSGSSYSRGGMGGEANHTLTIAEMPSHRHSMTYYNNSGDWIASHIFIESGNRQTTLYTDYQGNSQPHNNMQPYIALLYCVKN